MAKARTGEARLSWAEVCGRRLDVTVEPLRRLSAAHRRELAAQVARIGEFQQRAPQLTIGTVTAGGHA